MAGLKKLNSIIFLTVISLHWHDNLLLPLVNDFKIRRRARNFTVDDE